MTDTQRIVDHFGAMFFTAVQAGRGLSDRAMTAVTDGRIWSAQEARALGLIDGVETFDQALDAAARMRTPRAEQQLRGARQQLAQLRATWTEADNG